MVNITFFSPAESMQKTSENNSRQLTSLTNFGSALSVFCFIILAELQSCRKRLIIETTREEYVQTETRSEKHSRIEPGPSKSVTETCKQYLIIYC